MPYSHPSGGRDGLAWHVTCEACRRRTANTTEDNSLHGVCNCALSTNTNICISCISSYFYYNSVQNWVVSIFLINFFYHLYLRMRLALLRAALRPHCAHPAGDSETTQKPQWREGEREREGKGRQREYDTCGSKIVRKIIPLLHAS